MNTALGSSPRIPQMAPLAFEQIIIAGGDDDVSADDIFEWVAPLLAGIPGGRWMSCQLEFGSDGEVLAHYREGSSRTALSLTLDASEPATRELIRQLPEAQSMTMILLSDFTSQAVTLLDGIARWLSIHDLDDHKLTSVVRLLGGFQSVMKTA